MPYDVRSPHIRIEGGQMCVTYLGFQGERPGAQKSSRSRRSGLLWRYAVVCPPHRASYILPSKRVNRGFEEPAVSFTAIAIRCWSARGQGRRIPVCFTLEGVYGVKKWGSGRLLPTVGKEEFGHGRLEPYSTQRQRAICRSLYIVGTASRRS